MFKKSNDHCKNLMKDHSGTIFINCGHLVGPFNINWNKDKEIISINDFIDRPINFAW